MSKHPPVLPPTGFNQLYETRYGHCLLNCNDLVVGRIIANYGEYFESEVNFFRHICRPGDVAVDVGANIGSHTMALARIVGPKGFVYAWEPQRLIFQTLCANMALNSLTHVECVHAAAAAEAGYVFMPNVDYKKPVNFGGLSVSPKGSGRPVQKRRMDDVIKGGPVRLIKIDVEGMETDVLLGSRQIIQMHKPLIYVENDRIDKSPKLIGTIFSLGYRAYWHFPDYFNPRNFYKNPKSIHYRGLIDLGERYAINGFAINLVCVPTSGVHNIVGLDEVEGVDDHPLKKDSPLLHDSALLRGLPIAEAGTEGRIAPKK